MIVHQFHGEILLERIQTGQASSKPSPPSLSWNSGEVQVTGTKQCVAETKELLQPAKGISTISFAIDAVPVEAY